MTAKPCNFTALKTHRYRGMAHLLLALGLVAGSSFAQAQTTWTGTTSTNWFTGSNWTGGTPTFTTEAIIDLTSPNSTTIKAPGATAQYVVVGNNGTGLLALSSGGTLVTDSDHQGSDGTGLYIGFGTGSTGSVTLTGSGTSLTSGLSGGSNISVGALGNGALVIRNGATVTDNWGEVGQGGGANTVSTADVTGTGATWTNKVLLVVGDSSHASLTVEKGGTVTTGVFGNGTGLFIGNGSDGVGNVTVTDVGSTLNLNNGSADIQVGNSGSGTLTIANGGVVTNHAAYIGDSTGTSTGVVDVTGTGSTWTNNGTIAVGDQGNGTLTVEKGGTVTMAGDSGPGNPYAGLVVGSASGSTGVVTVTGTGSTLSAANFWGGYIVVGDSGNGTLTVRNGGSVTAGIDANGYGLYVGNQANSTGTVTVTGTGSNLAATGAIAVGNNGNGTMTISNGATVTTGGDFMFNTGVFVAAQTGSTGTLTVTGSGTKLTVGGNGSSNLNVGFGGTGTMIISGGAVVTDQSGFVGADFDVYHGTGSLDVTGTGSTWNNSSLVSIDNGTATVEKGGTVTTGVNGGNTGFLIGTDVGTTASVTVTGTGSSITVGSSGSGNLYIGNSGNGTLNINNSGTVTDNIAYIGEASGSTGNVVVNGGTWTNNSSVFIGDQGNGTLVISSGGTVTDSSASLGHDGGSAGNVDVNGGTWINSDIIYVGDDSNGGSSTGTVTIENGGKVTTDSDGASIGLFIGTNAGATGVLTVTGNGSSLTVGSSGTIFVGQDGNGTMIIDNKGSVSATTVVIANSGDSTGLLQIGNNDAAGTLTTTSIQFGAGTGTLEFDQTNTMTINATISGSGTVIQQGSGTTVLGGANTYTGITQIYGGTLSVSADNNLGDASTGVTFNGGTLETTATFSSDRAITLTGSGTFQTDTGTLTLANTISGTGSLSKTGNGMLILSGSNTYSGGTNLNDGRLSVSADANLGDASGGLNFNGGTLETTAGFTSDRLVALNVSGTFQTDTGSLTLTNTVSGTGVLSKTGNGELVLSGSNTYSGGTNINHGIVSVSADANLGNASGGLNFSGGTLETTAGFTSDRSITLSGSGIFQTDTGTLILTNSISGTGSLSKTGTATLVLSGANTYSGGTFLRNGKISVSADNNLGDAAGGLNFRGGTLETTASFSSARAIMLSGNGTFQTDTGSLALTNTISGTGSLSKTGTGSLVLTGSNTYSGGTNLNAGTLSVSADNNLGDASGGLTFKGGGTLETTASFTSARTITLNANGTFQTDTGTLSLTNTISGNSSLTKTGTGTLLLSGSNTYSGGTNLNTGTLSVSADNNLGDVSGTLTFNGGTLETTASFTSNRLVTLNGTGTFQTDTGTLALTNTVSGTASLLKVGAGTLALSGTNTYSGGTTINAGILEADSNNALGTGTVIVNDDTTLSLVGNITVGNDITISGTGTFGQGAILGSGNSATPGVSGTVTLVGNATVGSSGTLTSLVLGDIQLGTHFLTTKGGTVTLVGGISGTGGLNIANTTQIEGGSNSFAGLTDVLAGGSLFLVNVGNLAIPGDLTIENGGLVTDEAGGQLSTTTLLTINGTGAFVLDSTLSGSSVSESIAGLTGTSTTASIATISSTLVQDSITLNGTGSYSFAGAIADSVNAPLALILSGSGTQTLSGANTFRGGTTLNSGALVVASPTALGVGDVTVDGGTLATDGINHLIDIGGNYTQGAGGTLVLSLFSPTVYDTVALTGTGTANLNGTLKLNIVGSFAPGEGQEFTLMSTNNTITGSFSVVTTNLPSITGTIDYTNDVTLLFQGSFVNLPGLNLNPNQKAVAIYVDAHDKFINSPGFAALVGALNSVSGDSSTLAGAFNQLMPVNFANFVSSNAFNNASFTTQQLDTYLANHRGADGTFVGSQGGIDYSGLAVNNPEVDPALQSVRSRLLAWSPAASTGLLSDSSSLVEGGSDMKEIAAPSGASNEWNVFIDGNVILAQDFSNNSVSLPYNSTTTGAVQIGADYKFTPHLLAGVTFGYGNTTARLDTIGSNAHVDTYSPGIYMSYTNNGWYFNALASYGFDSYSQGRNVNIAAFGGTAHSSPGGDQIVANLDGGYDFHKGNWTFGPTLGLQYVHLDVDGYTETGLPGADLTVNRDQSDSLRSRIGGEVSYAVKSGNLIFTPHLSASWQHDFMDQSRGITSQFSDVGAGSFVVNTANPSRDSALMDIGVDAQINDALTIFSDYSLQAGQSNYFGQSVQAGLKIGF